MATHDTLHYPPDHSLVVHVVEVEKLLIQCMLQEMLTFFNDAFKEEFFIGEHWVVIHEVCGNSFLTQLAKLFQDVPLWLLLPSEDLIVYPFTLFPRIAITNLFDKLIDSKLSCI